MKEVPVAGSTRSAMRVLIMLAKGWIGATQFWLADSTVEVVHEARLSHYCKLCHHVPLCIFPI